MELHGEAAPASPDAEHREGHRTPAAYLDTSVFIYAAGGRHTYREACRQLLDAARAGRVTVTTSVEVVQEIVHLYLGRKERDRAVEVAEAAMALVARVLPVEENDVRSSLSLVRAVRELTSRDAIHAALCLRYECPIVSADRDFDGVPGLRRIDPRDAASELLRTEGPGEPES